MQVDPDIADRLNNEIRHGFRGHLMGGLLKLALDAIEKDGDIMLGALIAGKYKLVPDIHHD
jgi:hypothetical protein